jgi:bifunctional UDP-N-acetylglucosamine pyrophosphorylase/glucosamine-1-phosphate N-acetyltransferase
MKSSLPKVMHPVLGRPMISRVIESARSAGLDDIVIVVGYGRNTMIPYLEDYGIPWQIQEEQLGTAHAVRCGLKNRNPEEVVVLLGDVPLLQPDTILDLVDGRRRESATVAVLTTCPPDVSGYGRIMRSGGCDITGIVEERDADPRQREITEINTGLMVFDGKHVRNLIDSVESSNSQGEYYLTDTIGIAVDQGLRAIAVKAPDWREVSGINTPEQLLGATLRLRELTVAAHMTNGVTIPVPESVWIEETVKIGEHVFIGRDCRLTGNTVIGRNCRLEEGCIVISSILPDGTMLDACSVVEEVCP